MQIFKKNGSDNFEPCKQEDDGALEISFRDIAAEELSFPESIESVS